MGELMGVSIAAEVCCHVGRVRTNNEDNFFFNGFNLSKSFAHKGIVRRKRSDASVQLYAVCDGMGGQAAGEEASFIGTDMMHGLLRRLRNSADPHIAIDDYTDEANKAVAKLDNGAGCTLAMVCIAEGKAIVSWLGDSRVYMLRSGKLRQLTQDHTEAERLRKLGIAAADKRSHNSLTRYLGMNMEGMVLTPSYCEPITIKKKDMFLICSDGLTSMVNDEEIAAIMRESQKPAYDLVNAALEAGGTDNVTAAVIGVESLKQWQMKRSIKSRTVLALTLCMPFMQAR